jgi:REP element-mobilizing transposase RayT
MSAFFDWNQRVDTTQRQLPHWSQKRVIYFATFRLADSIPKPILSQWIERKELWLADHPEPHDEATLSEYHRQFTWKFHDYLDRGHGKCLLANVDDSQIVANVLHFFDGTRYQLGEWVVMPNHVHVIFQTNDEWTPTQILHSWKSYSAKRINEHRKSRGQLWQHESYDRIVRSASELSRIEQYIRSNPGKAGLKVSHASCVDLEL